MNFLNKLKKEKETDAEKVKPIHSERKFSFRDALGNLKSAVFGKAVNIKELRLRRGVKQSELGEKISYSDKTISKWENGASVPDVTALVALAEAFGVSVSDMVKPDAVVIDVGMNRTPEKLCGDVCFEEVAEKASYITPVPGGVGPMTIACLMKNTLIAAKLQNGEE